MDRKIRWSRDVPIDAGGLAQRTMDSIHGLAHDERLYDLGHSVVDANFDTSDVETLAITAGVTKDVHLTWEIDVYGGNVSVALFKGATVTGGSAVTAYNHYTGSAETPDFTALSTPTLSAAGSQASPTRYVFSAATGVNKGSSSIRAGAEFIIPKGTTGYIKVTSLTDNVIFSLAATAYEA